MMAADRRVSELPDTSSSYSLPSQKRKIHSDDDPLPGPSTTSNPKRAKKGPMKRKLMIVAEPLSATTLDAASSSRLLPSRSAATAIDSSSTSLRAPTPDRIRSRSPSAQPVPYHRSSSTQPPPATSRSKPASTSHVAVPSSASKGKARQTSEQPSSNGRTRDVFDVSSSADAVPARGRSRQPSVTTDTTLPLPLRETPLIDRNREMRNKASARRRSSLEHRRRASESLGKNGAINSSAEPTVPISVIPHPNVPSTQFHRHISTDVLPVQRTRQLLVWSSSRTQQPQSSTTTPSSTGSSSPAPAPPLPKLSLESTESLKAAQDAVIRMLAEGTVDTLPYSEKGKDKDGTTMKNSNHRKKKGNALRPNPMNEKNMKRIEEWKAYIARAAAEEKMWLQIKTTANAQLAKLSQAHEAQALNSRLQRKPPEEWFPLLLDAVDEQWKEAALLARSTAELDANDVIDDATRELLRGVELHVDELEDMINTTYEMTHRAESLLNKFFATVSSQLSSRKTYGRPGVGAPSARQPSGMSLIELITMSLARGEVLLGSSTSAVPPADVAADEEEASKQPPRVDDTMATLRALSRLGQSSSSSTAATSKPSTSTAATSASTHHRLGVERRMTAVPPRTPGKEHARSGSIGLGMSMSRARTPKRGSTPGRNVKR